MKVARRIIGLALLIGLGALAWAMRHPELELSQAAPTDYTSEQVERGELLVRIGGCASCHGQDLSGGQALETPFGAIHSTNLTPDAETGLGLWSQAAFHRAMRSGIDRRGNYLYPAFPYDNFTNATDEDLDSIYAFLQSVPAVSRPAGPNRLSFPFNIRLLMAGWNTLFLRQGPMGADPNQSANWNRGAYLAEGLGHCSACHTPRNMFGARVQSAAYSGSMTEGWWSPALDSSLTSPLGWNEDELINYFFDGWDENHGIAAGPMHEVVTNISYLPEEDVTALATYIGSLSAAAPQNGSDRDSVRQIAQDAAMDFSLSIAATGDAQVDAGAEVFALRCANCHKSGSETVPLALATAVTGPRAENFVRVVLDGVSPTENAYFVRPMPGVSQLTNTEIANLAAFVRRRFTGKLPWADVTSVLNTLQH
jgi:mono/diheme cytochrome c family protein